MSGAARTVQVAIALALAASLASGCDDSRDDRPTGETAPRPVSAPAAGAPGTRGPATAGVRIPARYHGRYAADVAACGRPGDPGQLEVTAAALAFHESRGEVLRVEEDPGGMAVVAALAGEGDTWEATYRFALSADGRVLTDRDGGMARVRCP